MSMTISEIQESQKRRNAEYRELLQTGKKEEARRLALKRLKAAGILDEEGEVAVQYR